MSMDKKLTSAVYAAVEKAYDHRCDIEDAADEILEIIKADRKRRGEPVAWIRKNGFSVLAGIEPQDDSEVPLYAAPQPAEPVKVPSDADILELWTGDPTHSRPVMGKNKVIAFARALLARYCKGTP